MLMAPSFGWCQSSPFQDIPRDHWAFGDVDFLVKAGYWKIQSDGAFAGRRILTRYDLALTLARILRRLDEKKAGDDKATEEEKAAISRLVAEFRDELSMLGVRVDTLEKRAVDMEKRLEGTETALPKTRISGYLRSTGQFIIEPVSVQRDETGSQTSFLKPGLQTLYNQAYVRFTGKPLGERIEVFGEIYGYIKGRSWNALQYSDSGKPSGTNPFDNVDDYLYQVSADRYLQMNKVHFVSNARSLQVRVFANENVTELTDPMNIFTEDADVVDPHNGVEFQGTDGGLSYQGGVYNNDLRAGYTDKSEMAVGRLVWKLPAKFSPDSLTLGTSYAEKIADYTVRGNSNTVRGVDLSYSTERAGKIQADLEFLTSTDHHKLTHESIYDEEEVPAEDEEFYEEEKPVNLKDQGMLCDVSVQKDGFTGTFKHYDFGRDFRARMAPIWAYDIGEEDVMSDYPFDPVFLDNYKHEGFWGEKLTRFSAAYEFGETLTRMARNVSMEVTYLSKTWEVDPYNPQATDGYSGRKFTYQFLSDFTDSSTLKYDLENKLDALPDEEGTLKHTVELDVKLGNSVGTKARFMWSDDRDEIHTLQGKTWHRNDRTGYLELNAEVNPRLSAKGSVEHQARWTSAPLQNIRIDYIGESTYNINPLTSLTGGVQHVDFEDRGDADNSSLANAILGELKRNFSEKFRGKAFYTRGLIEYKTKKRKTIDRENIFGELIYDVSKDSSVKLKFGYDYPFDDRWDITSVENGREEKDIHTQKMLIFEARTNF